MLHVDIMITWESLKEAFWILDGFFAPFCGNKLVPSLEPVQGKNVPR